MRSCGVSRLKTDFDSCRLFRDDGFGVFDLSKSIVYDKKENATFKGIGGKALILQVDLIS